MRSQKSPKRHLLVFLTIAVLVCMVSVAFVYGKSKAESSDSQKSYFERLNDYDWSKTCPGASCRKSD